MKKFSLFYVAALSLPLLALTACDAMTQPKTTTDTGTINERQATTAYVDDGALSRDVTAALQREPLFSNGNITVTSQQGQVELTGFVAAQADMNKAAEIAGKVQGVNKVTNNLVLKPVGITN